MIYMVYSSSAIRIWNVVEEDVVSEMMSHDFGFVG